MIQFELPTGHHEYWYDCQEVSKHLGIKHDGKYLGRNKFMQMLRFNGLLMKDSNAPTQTMIQLGLMRFHFAKKQYKAYGMPLFSDKGIAWLQNRVTDGRLQVGFLKRREKQCVTLDEVC